MKKIGILLPSLVGGGAERLHILLAKSWIKLGFSVNFVVLDNKKVAGTLQTLIPHECRIIVLGETRLRKTIFPISKILKKEEFDIFLAPMWPMTVIAVISKYLILSKTKIVVSDHTHLSSSRLSELKIPLFILRFSIGIFYRLANGIICVSKGVRNDISALGLIKESKITVIYNPVAQEGYKQKIYSQEEVLSFWPRPYTNKILSAGSLIHQKNYTLLIEAFSKLEPEVLNDSQLVILGGGELKDKLLEQIESLNLTDRIFLLGFKLDPLPWFETANLFVLSSNWEGFGNVIVEALQSRLPIVSTNCKSGPDEILENGKYGKLVSTGNAEELSLAISAQLRAEHDFDILYKRSQDFTVSKASREYQALFQEILN